MHSSARYPRQVRSVLALAGSVAGKVLLSKRTLLVLLVEAMVLWDVLGPVETFVSEIGYRVGPWLFVFVAQDPICQLFFVLGLVFLLAGAPFVSAGEASVAVRVSRTSWALSRLCVVVFVSLAYYLALLVLSWVFTAPWMTFAADGWGTAIVTLTETDAGAVAGFTLAFDNGVVSALGPWEALGLAFGFEVLGGVILGMVIVAVNALTASRAGIALAAFLALFDLLAINTLPYAVLLYSPVSHARLQIFDFTGTSPYLPTPGEALAFDIVLAVGFGMLAFWAMRRMDINQQAQD